MKVIEFYNEKLKKVKEDIAGIRFIENILNGPIYLINSNSHFNNYCQTKEIINNLKNKDFEFDCFNIELLWKHLEWFEIDELRRTITLLSRIRGHSIIIYKKKMTHFVNDIEKIVSLIGGNEEAMRVIYDLRQQLSDASVILRTIKECVEKQKEIDKKIDELDLQIAPFKQKIESLRTERLFIVNKEDRLRLRFVHGSFVKDNV